MIISIPDSWVSAAMPQPMTSAGRTQGRFSPLHPRSRDRVSALRSSTSTISSSSAASTNDSSVIR